MQYYKDFPVNWSKTIFTIQLSRIEEHVEKPEQGFKNARLKTN